MTCSANIVVDYTFYTDVYQGTLPEGAFLLAIGAGSRHVRWLCAGQRPRHARSTERYKRAICAATEAFAEFGQGQVGGFSVGDFKVTSYENRGTTGSEQATIVALQELVGTGLAFSGVR